MEIPFIRPVLFEHPRRERGDLISEKTVPRSERDLAQAIVGSECRASAVCADDFGRAARATERTCHDGSGGEFAKFCQALRDRNGLGDAAFGQRRIELPLIAALSIPLRLTVANEQETHASFHISG